MRGGLSRLSRMLHRSRVAVRYIAGLFELRVATVDNHILRAVRATSLQSIGCLLVFGLG